MAPVSGGVKIGQTRGVTVTDSAFVDNFGHGFWTDMSVYDTVVRRSDFNRNAGEGLFLEISARALVVDSLFLGNERSGIKVNNTSNVKIWNNTIVGNGRSLWLAQDGRRNTNPSDPAVDPRVPFPDPEMPWELQDLSVSNNVIGLPEGTTNCVLCVEDYSKQESGEAMRIFTDGNVYNRSSSSSPSWLVIWSRGATSPSVHTTLDSFRAATGREARGREYVGTAVVSPAGVLSAGVRAVADDVALPLPADLAAEAGQAAGVRHLGAWVDGSTAEPPTTTTPPPPTTTHPAPADHHHPAPADHHHPAPADHQHPAPAGTGCRRGEGHLHPHGALELGQRRPRWRLDHPGGRRPVLDRRWRRSDVAPSRRRVRRRRSTPCGSRPPTSRWPPAPARCRTPSATTPPSSPARSGPTATTASRCAPRPTARWPPGSCAGWTASRPCSPRRRTPAVKVPTGRTLLMRLRVTGQGTSSLQAKVWAAGTPEPDSWWMTATDSTASLQGAGSPGLYAYSHGSARGRPVTIYWDALHGPRRLISGRPCRWSTSSTAGSRCCSAARRPGTSPCPWPC